MFFNKWQVWVGIGVSVGLLLILIYQVNLGELKDALADANYTYLAPAVVLYFGAVLFRTIRWRYLLLPLREFSVRRLYPVVIIGYMANNLLPVRLGEVVRAYYLARQENFSTGSALGTIAVERLFDGITILAFAAISAPWLLFLGEFEGAANVSRTTVITLTVLAVAAFGGFLAFFTLLAGKPEFAARMERLVNLLPARLRPAASRFYWTFVSGLGVLTSPRKQLALLVLSVPVWVAEGAMYFLIAYSFNLDAHFGSTGVLILAAALLTATSNLATAVPNAIGGIGPFEIVAQQTLIALGVGASVAGAYAGFVHLVALWLPVNLVGLALLWKQNLSLKQLVRSWQNEGLEAAPGLAGSPGNPQTGGPPP